ncbi:MAG: AbrB/MazE/SpoVT family DNA-binding domain-containing protein [Nitrososphaeria archaeon]|nr:AbrB/MazE/SpoVT family DNA-binding domain-containing protein [Nitrososphaeria archaeon]
MKKSDFILVRKRGVIILPKKIRDALKIGEGDILKIQVNGSSIVLSKEDLWGKLFGCAKGIYNPDDAEIELDRGEIVEEGNS